MKKLLLLVFLLTLQMQITAQTTYVPDDNFEQVLIDLGYDDVLDDYVLTSNIDGVTYLAVSNRDIADLTGIEDFIALTNFNCFNNQISTLDFSQNTALIFLKCYENQLTTLDVSQNTALTLLWCDFNQLNTLDVSQNTALTSFSCSNNSLTILDVSQHTALILLMCEVNQLIDLDIRNGNNANMSAMWAFDNPNLPLIWVDNENATYPDCDILNYLGWCKDETTEYSISIEEITSSNNIIIHPNPTADQLFIDNTTNLNIQSVLVYDILDKLVLQEHNNFQQIDVSLLNSGIYLVKIETDSGVITKKVIKK